MRSPAAYSAKPGTSPATEPGSPMPNIVSSTPPRRAAPIVLIANSDSAARCWIEATVSSAGLQAQSFGSASELLARCPSNVASCAILDVTLCDASGFEVQDKLRRAGTTVLFLTREPCIASSVRALKAGAIDFLTLPCDSGDLVRALGHAMRHALASWSKRERLSELRSRYAQLTPRERDVFALVVSGMRNKQIAHHLDIKHMTVQIHRGRVMQKMRARSLAALVRMADALQAATATSCSMGSTCW